MATFLCIGVTILHFSEAEVWRMTPFKLLELYKAYKELMMPARKASTGEADIDDILSGKVR